MGSLLSPIAADVYFADLKVELWRQPDEAELVGTGLWMARL